MKDRLKAVIQYKTNGDLAKFAELTGVTPRYIWDTNNRDVLSLPYIIKVLDAVKELDARWLLTGEGVMVRPWGLSLSESLFMQKVSNVMRLASLIPKMTSEQIVRFQVAVAKGDYPDFTEDEINKLAGGNDGEQ